MSLPELAAASVIMALGSIVQGSIGFGLNVVAAPALVLIDTSFVPGPTLAAALVLTVIVGVRERGSIDYQGFRWIFIGRVPGSMLAAILVSSLPETGIAVALSAVVLAAVAMSLVGWRLARTPPNLVGAGAVSGVMNTLSSVGGPPIAMLYQDSRGAELRGTLAAVFSVGAFVSLLLLAAVGRYGSDEFNTSLVLVPGVVVGYIVSLWTARFLDRRSARPWVLGLSAASALAAIVRYAL